jgi:hypothetical protein
MKAKLFIFAAVIFVCAIGGWLLLRPPAPEAIPVEAQPASPVVTVAEAPSAPAEQTTPAEPVKEPPFQPAPKPKSSPQPAAQSPAVQPAKEPLHDPEARDALALVGLDPEAEQYWLDAIYDASLPDNEREDLMEDLNEVGFADPKNLTTDDLPLIVNRIDIIESILPNSDDFMRPHLLEAEKDLVNMFGQAARQ